MAVLFVSYTGSDKSWAEWIAWELETEGHRAIIQAWDFRPGMNFLLEMDRAAREADHMIAVLSPAYVEANFTQPEWAAAMVADATGQDRQVIPVRVHPVELKGILRPILYIDFVGKDEGEARAELKKGIAPGRAKPAGVPFPGVSRAAEPPVFPGKHTGGSADPRAWTFDVVGIGSVCVDWFAKVEESDLAQWGLSPGDDRLAERGYSEYLSMAAALQREYEGPGGKITNSSIVLSLLGLRVALLGAIGSDDLGEHYSTSRLAGISTVLLHRKGNTPVCFCLVSGEERERTFYYVPNPEEGRYWRDVDLGGLTQADWLSVGPIYAGGSVREDVDIVRGIVASAQDKPVAFSPGDMWCRFGGEDLMDLIAMTDTLFISETEASYLGCDEGAKAAAEVLTDHGPRTVVCTAGATGAWIATRGGQAFFSAPTPVRNGKLIDTTAAGDVFSGGFLAARLSGLSTEVAAAFANQVASLSVTDYGLRALHQPGMSTLLRHWLADLGGGLR